MINYLKLIVESIHTHTHKTHEMKYIEEKAWQQLEDYIKLELFNADNVHL